MKSKIFDNLGLKILALVSAIVIWILVVSINDPVANKTFRDVKVNVINEEVVTSEGKTYQIENGATANVTVRAQRSVLSRLKADRIVATADMKDMTLSSMIPVEVSITGYEGRYQRATANPVNIQVSIEDIITNKYPITVSTSGSLRDGYALAGTEVDPETVTISGPESVINSIDHAAAKISLDGISSDKTIRSELILYDSDNNKIDQSRLTNNIGEEGIKVKVQVYPTRDVPIAIDSDQITTPEGYYISDVSYEPTTIEIAAEKARLESIKEIQIPPEAFDLSDVTKKTEVTLDIEEYLPENTILAAEGSKVVFTFNVTKYGEKTFDYPTGSIIVNNLADDLQLDYGQTDHLEITIKGPMSALEKLTLNKAASIDLASYTKPGFYQIPVQVKLPDGCSAKEISVSVTLQEKE